MKFVPLSRLNTTRTTIVLPAFTLASSWTGLSYLLGRFPVGNTRAFSLKLPIEPQDSFLLAVSWSASPYFFRYKLYEDVGEKLSYPVYNGEKIGLGAYFEVWSVAGTSYAMLSSNLSLSTSWINQPTACPACSQNSVEQVLDIVTPSSVPVGGYCNPFCSPIC